MRFKTCALALTAGLVFGFQESKPIPKDTQISILKAQRSIQQLQIQIAELQRQYDVASANIKQLQVQLEADCAAAAKESNIDTAKYVCDLDKLSFVPRQSAPSAASPQSAAKP